MTKMLCALYFGLLASSSEDSIVLGHGKRLLLILTTMGFFLGLLALGGLAWLLGSGSSNSHTSSSYNSYDYQPRQSVDSSYGPASYRTAVRTTTLSTTESTEVSTESLASTPAFQLETTSTKTSKNWNHILELLHMPPVQVNNNSSHLSGEDNSTEALTTQSTEYSTEFDSSIMVFEENTTTKEMPKSLEPAFDLPPVQPFQSNNRTISADPLAFRDSPTESSSNVNMTTSPLERSVQLNNTTPANETVKQDGDNTPSVTSRFLLSWNQVFAADAKVISSCNLPGVLYYIDINDQLRRVSTTGLFTSANVVLASSIRHFAQGFDGSVWYITKSGQLWRMRRQEKPVLVPHQIEGALVFVAARSYTEAAVATVNGTFYRWTHQGWFRENNASNVSVIGLGNDGSLLYADSNQTIWKRDVLTGKHVPYEINGQRFGIYNADTVIVIDDNSNVQKRMSGVWIPVSEKCSDVSVGEDSFVCLGSDGMAKLMPY